MSLLLEVLNGFLFEIDVRTLQDSLSDDRESLPFGNIFGENLRIAKTYIPQYLNDIKDVLREDYGYELDIESGIVHINKETQRGPKKTSIRLGKVLNQLLKRSNKVFDSLDKEQLEFLKRGRHYLGGKFPEWLLDAIKDGIPDYPSKYRGPEHEIIDFARRITLPSEEVANELTSKKWIEEAIEDYNQYGHGYSVVISRSPVDVLRMSDFKNIQSCHSQGGSYWQCAVTEAQNGGAVVYMVKSKDLEEVDINSDEIFTDPERGIEGLNPISRIRLRNFVLEETEDEEEYELAVPELTSYGLELEGFLEDVTEWTRQQQLSDFEDEDGIIAMPDIESFKIRGGSYTDNQGSSLLNNFFDREFYRGDVENEDESASVSLHDQYFDEAEQYEHDIPLNNVDVRWEVEDGGEGEPYLIWGGHIQMTFPEDDDYTKYITEELNYAISAINDAANGVVDLDKYLANAMEDRYGIVLGYSFDIGIDGESMGHPDEFADFLRYCQDIDNVVPAMQKAWEKAYWEIKKKNEEEAKKEEEEWELESKKADKEFDSRND